MSKPQGYVENDPRIHIVEVTCPKCGKIFCPAPYHRFKANHKFYCSWTCYSHREEKNDETVKKEEN